MAIVLDGTDAIGDLGDALNAKLNVAGGKILQVVRATDTTERSTTSTSYVDVTGMSVTITPQKSTSAIILIYTSYGSHESTSDYLIIQIADSSNNGISSAQNVFLGSGTTSVIIAPLVAIGYATPATTSPVTFKLRFRVSGSGAGYLYHQSATGQMLAIEVSA